MLIFGNLRFNAAEVDATEFGNGINAVNLFPQTKRLLVGGRHW